MFSPRSPQPANARPWGEGGDAGPRPGSAGALEHPTRLAILATVRARPGVHLSALTREVGGSRSTVVHHVHVLARAQCIVLRPAGRAVHCFPRDAPCPEDWEVHALLARPTPRSVALAVHANPGSPRSELARRLGLAPSTLAEHLNRLVKAGLIEEATGRGTQRLPRPAPHLGGYLAPWTRLQRAPPAPTPAPSPPPPESFASASYGVRVEGWRLPGPAQSSDDGTPA